MHDPQWLWPARIFALLVALPVAALFVFAAAHLALGRDQARPRGTAD